MNKEQKIAELRNKLVKIYDKIDSLENRMIEVMDEYNDVANELSDIDEARYTELDVKIIVKRIPKDND
jgi:hypothetical protein